MTTRSHPRYAAPALLLTTLAAGVVWAAPSGADTPTPTAAKPSPSATAPVTSPPTTVSPTPIFGAPTPAFTGDPGAIAVPAGHVDVGGHRGAAEWPVTALVAGGVVLAGAGALAARRR